MAEQVLETLRRVQAGRWIVRLWIWGWREDVANDLEARVRVIADQAEDGRQLCRQIGEMPHVNAVEVLDYATLNGHLMYPEWP